MNFSSLTLYSHFPLSGSNLSTESSHDEPSCPPTAYSFPFNTGGGRERLNLANEDDDGDDDEDDDEDEYADDEDEDGGRY